jgi:molybdenum cofactor cytidylyltransferase
VIAGILLAAGASRRFGGNKLLAPLGDRPVIRWSADALVSAVDATFVVRPVEAPGLRDALADLTVHWVPNADRDEGMASSLRCGIAALPPGTEAVVVSLGDQPLVAPAVAPLLVARWRAGGVHAVAPRYDDGRGHPVLFGAVLFARLLALGGDRGARAVLDGLGDELALVPVPGPQPLDVDTPALLRAAAKGLRREA